MGITHLLATTTSSKAKTFVEDKPISIIGKNKRYNEMCDNYHKSIKLFADEMMKPGQSGEHYQTERNASQTQVKGGIKYAKGGELMVANYMHDEHDYPMLLPDMEVRKGKDKGWRIDLPYHEKDPHLPPIHVKCATDDTIANVGKLSWTFQWSNRRGYGGRDPLFDLNRGAPDVIAFVHLPAEDATEGTLKAMLLWDAIRWSATTYLKDPEKPYLRGIKLCVDHEDLIRDRDKLVRKQT